MCGCLYLGIFRQVVTLHSSNRAVTNCFTGKVDPSNVNGYSIPSEWQSALSNGSSAGGIIGLMINGWAADRYGPRIVMMVATVALTAFIFLFVFANSLGMLVAAEVVSGQQRRSPWETAPLLTHTVLWSAMGCLPDLDNCLRLGGVPYSAPWLPDCRKLSLER